MPAGGISIDVRHFLKPYVSIRSNHDDFIVWLCFCENICMMDKPVAIGIVYFLLDTVTFNTDREDCFSV